MRLRSVSRRWVPKLAEAALWAILAFSTGALCSPLAARALGWYQARDSQRELREEWKSAAAREPSLVRVPVLLTGSKTSRHQKNHARSAPPSFRWTPTRLVVPSIGLDAIVVQGTSLSALRKGPGHDPGSSPAGGRHCVIAAHRNMAGWWFYRLNEVQPGERILLETPGHSYWYTVTARRVVPVNQLQWIKEDGSGKSALTLYTCTLPKTKRRLLVRAELRGF